MRPTYSRAVVSKGTPQVREFKGGGNNKEKNQFCDKDNYNK